jgi:hypothetical protein
VFNFFLPPCRHPLHVAGVEDAVFSFFSFSQPQTSASAAAAQRAAKEDAEAWQLVGCETAVHQVYNHTY